MYRIDVRASHYEINPSLLITCTLYSLDRLYRQTVVPPRHRSTVGDRAFPVKSELSSADRPVAAVTARVQATAQVCAVCPLLRLFALRSSLLLIC